MRRGKRVEKRLQMSAKTAGVENGILRGRHFRTKIGRHGHFGPLRYSNIRLVDEMGEKGLDIGRRLAAAGSDQCCSDSRLGFFSSSKIFQIVFVLSKCFLNHMNF